VSLLELFVLSTALGTDLFSVSIPIGMNRVRIRVILKSAVVFAVFHIVMILTGYFVGHWLGTFVEHVGTYHIDSPALAVQNWASAIGALVLAGLGVHMIKENLAADCNDSADNNPLHGTTLILLAISVSIDALAAGFSLGMMDVDLIKLSIILGLVIFTIAIVGLGLGRRLGCYIGRRSELIGGLILLILGGHILCTALF
jgi:putative Mn2+ efflux pump MntP